MNTLNAITNSDASMLLNLVDWEDNMASKDEVERSARLARWRLRAILFILAIVGLVLNFLASYSPTWLEPIVREFGSALIVASVIGATVDLFFKEEFARDVFMAAFRYVLPEELKEEVLRVIGGKFMCTDSRMIVRVEQIPNTDLVKVHIGTDRTIKNISGDRQAISVAFALDDWGFVGQQPNIEECSFDLGDGPQECPTEGHDDPAIGKRKNDIWIKPGNTIKVVMKGYEIHRENDALRGFHTNPANNPTVQVQIPEGFKHTCSFGIPNEKIIPSKIDHNYQLDGTQFPGQCTYIRWWRDKIG
jgi:hypothetical protein